MLPVQLHNARRIFLDTIKKLLFVHHGSSRSANVAHHMVPGTNIRYINLYIMTTRTPILCTQRSVSCPCCFVGLEEDALLRRAFVASERELFDGS